MALASKQALRRARFNSILRPQTLSFEPSGDTAPWRFSLHRIAVLPIHRAASMQQARPVRMP